RAHVGQAGGCDRGPAGMGFGRQHSRVRRAPEALGQFPLSCLAEEIDTPGPGQIKALVVICGNPVISAPDAGRLDAALPQLDAMISLDNALNETSRHADVILPGLSALEQPHCDELLWGWATRSAAKWSPPLFPPAEDRPHEWEILLRLGAICAGIPPDTDAAAIDDGYFSNLAALSGADPEAALAASPEPGPERLNDLAIRMGPWGDRYGENSEGLTLEKLKEHPDGVDFGPMVPRIDEIVLHDDGKIDLAPGHIIGDVGRLADRLDRPVEPLVLTSRRHLRSNNSWMHNVRVLVSGKDRCTLLIHPDDAAARGVDDGAVAVVSSSNGSIEVSAEVSDEMMPGVVSLPHGWGHDKPGTRQSVAREHAGVNNNLLAPPDFLDVPSGNAAVNGIPVEVVPA
ncbi:MAG: molybdopterin-dependent oxidoreductase, partial [Acidimicrobiaceae bacterium]|nr:molybdopterin-dependent oxidoreductase [Acidimicrobiaceae bacterium]